VVVPVCFVIEEHLVAASAKSGKFCKEQSAHLLVVLEVILAMVSLPVVLLLAVGTRYDAVIRI
jgi:hypothetical protein